MSFKKLNIGDFGDDVANLHERLKKHGFSVTSEEVKRKFFGPKTREAVGEFQKINRIDPSYEVCEKTLSLLATHPTKHTAAGISVVDRGVTEGPNKITLSGDTVINDATNSNFETLSANSFDDDARIDVGKNPRRGIGFTSEPESRVLRISFPIKLLNRGEAVADLHDALRFLKFDIADRESEVQRFGRITRKSVLAFQKKQGLTETGQVDQETASRLNEALETSDYFSKKKRPFRNRECLRCKLRDTKRLDNTAQNFVRERLTERFKETIISQFKRPSEALQTAIHGLALDYEALVDQSLGSVMQGHIVPTLLEHADLEDEIEQLADLGFSKSTEKISQLLYLDQPIKQHPFFTNEAREVKNDAVANIVQLNKVEMDAMDEVDLTLLDRNTVDQFVIDGRLRAEVRDDLINVAEFAKLTDDDFVAVEALRGEGVNRPEDLIVRDHKDWVAFLDRHNIEPPEGQDRSDFAKIMDLNVQLTFRTPYTMERFSRGTEEVFEKINDLTPLFARNNSVFVDMTVNQELDLSDIPEEERPRIQASMQTLNKFANRYARLGAREILNDATLSIDEKKSRIIKRQAALGTFHKKNPDFDFERVNLFSIDSDMGRAFKPNWEDIDNEDVKPVKKLLSAMQRTYHLTTTHDEMDALLAAGLDSADAVRRLPEVELLQVTGLGKDVIRRIRTQAINTGVRTNNFISMVEEIMTHRASTPDAIGLGDLMGNDAPDQGIINLLKEIDGYADLFGNQNYCRCKHCRSIFSPGAYFVDLMRFIDTHITRPHFNNAKKLKHALNLRKRRPDLWNLQLSCKNTDTLIPYLTIVNEVLASYLERVFDETDIFDALTTARISFRQPFNLPFAELQLYLRHFGVKLEHIYALFNGSETDRVRAVLGLSPEEFATIVAPDPDEVALRYGNPENIAQLDVQNLINRMNITRADLSRLLALNYVRIDLLTDFEITSKRNDLVGFTETLKISLDSTVLSTQLESIVHLLLDRLHRFVRLWRALSWTPEDIDLVIGGVKLGNGLDVEITPTNTENPPKIITEVINGRRVVRVVNESHGNFTNKKQEHQLVGSRLNAYLLSIIADMQRLQDDLSLSFQEAYALVVDLPHTGSSSDKPGIFQRLFGDVATLSIKHPALGNSDDDPFVSPDFGALQGGLRLNEAELLGLVKAKLSETVIAAGTVSHNEISQLYRYARLSRALGWEPSGLLIVGQILDLDLDQNETIERLLAIKAFQAFAEALDHTPFSLMELDWLLLSETNAPPGIIETNKLLADIKPDLETTNPFIFRPEDLLPIAGLDLDGARRLLLRLRQETDPEESTASWLRTVEKEETAYVTTVEMGAEPDMQVLQSAINEMKLVMATDDTPEVAEKKETIIADMAKAIAERLQTYHPVTSFINRLTEQLGVTTDSFSQLNPFMYATLKSPELLEQLFLWSNDEAVPASEELVNLVNEFQQHIYVWKTKLELPEESLKYITQMHTLFSLELPVVWNWENLRRLSLYHKFSGKTPESLAALHRLLDHWNGGAFHCDAKEDIALILDVSPFDLGPILERVAMPRNPFDALLSISNAASLVNTLGLDGVALTQLTATSYEGLKAAKNLVLGAMRAKYDEVKWPKIIEPYEDELNMLKRDALVDRILSREFQLKFSDTREIYQFFLLDVNMDGCARISRVKEAILACQLYIHRCLMSLEQSESGDVIVRIEQEAKDQWPWRKNYRVWEANRKVFLYPENYLEPDLRDNKSHIFRQAEAELMQRPLTPKGLEAIFKGYLKEFSELANIIIVSAYFEDSKDPCKEGTYHFFGRTRHRPYQYYSRKFIGLAQWTMWEPIDLTIEAKRVNAVKHKGQLYLFWLSPMKSEEGERVVGDQNTGEGDNGSPLTVNYSTLDERGEWSSVQSLIFYLFDEIGIVSKRRSIDRIFVESLNLDNDEIAITPNGKICLSHVYRLTVGFSSHMKVISGHLNELRNEILNDYGDQVELGDTKRLPFNELSNQTKYQVSGIVISSSGGHITADLVKSTAKGEASAQYLLSHVREAPEIHGGVGIGGSEEVSQSIRREVVSFPEGSDSDLMIVNNRVRDNIFQFQDQFLLIRSTGETGSGNQTVSSMEQLSALFNTKRRSYLLSTSVGAELAEKLFDQGLDSFLSLETQTIRETSLQQRGLEFNWLGELLPPIDEGNILRPLYHLDFKGAYGSYFREIFFHLPFLIGHYLNAKQKFADADYWYRKIFDPTAQPLAGKRPSKRDKWRFIEFHNLSGMPKLRDILTDEEAIEVYESDPFNPYAIARLRISAFQKAIVMRYIDNLLDWGDHLFSQDTFESINEATMLYVMAADILGDKPIEVGDCETADESDLTYGQIVLPNAAHSDFLIEMENFTWLHGVLLSDPEVPKMENVTWLHGVWLPDPEVPKKVFPVAGTASNGSDDTSAPSGFTAVRQIKHRSFVKASVLANSFAKSKALHADANANVIYSTAEDISLKPASEANYERDNDLRIHKQPEPPPPEEYYGALFYGDFCYTSAPKPAPERQDHLAFCVPPNETLLGYWDRVEDRLFKIRHCMNIEGVRRQLSLYQPPIDPALLVRLKAAGLSMDEITGLLGRLNASTPSYRFRALLEKARQFTATVQQLGSQIQAALERKDAEELILLQATQQDEINAAIQRIKHDNKRDANETRLSLQNAIETVKSREYHYQSLLDNAIDKELGISQEERDQLDHLTDGQNLQQKAMQSDKAASMRHFLPTWNADISAGGTVTPPYYMGHAIASSNFGSSNLAAKETMEGQKFRKKAQGHDFEASQAGLRASYERRKSEWVHQKQQAGLEFEQLQKQCLAAEIREEIADKDLELHKKQTEHARELYDFYKDKFTDLGLYTYLSTSLSRLYREAYNMAYDMALEAQQAYQFETDDTAFLLKNDNWDNRKAGLLAGERLLLQLQEMEKNYLERYRRQYEVTLPCSLAQINPQALLQLQQNGSCKIDLPEYWFDLYYPGQYKRRIKSIRVTIPCVTGPYTNVGAKLTLTESRIRLEPRLDPQSLVLVPAQRNTSIATSTANADPGIFEFNFNGEQYLPFEGAGAISKWRLELPGGIPRGMRVFDYSTISDVIVHVSYTAKDDGVYKDRVEGKLKNEFLDFAQLNQLTRLISLKHEFASDFHRLTHPQEGQPATTTIRLSKEHFPFFLQDKQITLGTSHVLLEAANNQEFIPTDLQNLNQNLSMRINDIEVSGWAFEGELNFPTSSSFNLNTLQITDEGNDLVITIEGDEIPTLANIWLELGYGIDD